MLFWHQYLFSQAIGNRGFSAKQRIFRLLDQLDVLTRKTKVDPRTDFADFDDDGDLVAYCYGDWKAVFEEQKKPGGGTSAP